MGVVSRVGRGAMCTTPKSQISENKNKTEGFLATQVIFFVIEGKEFTPCA